MSCHRSIISTFLLGLAASIALACGGTSRKIQTVTVSPATADASNFPGGKVQFTATGSYNQSPLTVTPLQANWGVASEQTINGVEQLGLVNGAVTIDANGVAQCSAGTSGKFSVAAWVNLPYSGPPPPCPINFYANMSCPVVSGTATLTCP